MKYKKLQILALCTLMGVGALSAQGHEGSKKKKFSGAILFGRGIYLGDPIVPTSPVSNSATLQNLPLDWIADAIENDDKIPKTLLNGLSDWTVSGEAPNVVGISSQNEITNMVGAEFRYFISDKVALKFNGSGIFKNTPAQENVTGVTPATSGALEPASPSAGWIPNYAATVLDNSLNVNVSLGAEYHFASANKLSPYVGLMVPFCYGRRSVYDPTVTVDMTKSLDDPSAVKITDVGNRHIEQIGFGGQFILGADYDLSESLFIGLEIKPVSYLYAYNVKYPAPGLETRKADTHAFGFFTQPVFKIGFRF